MYKLFYAQSTIYSGGYEFSSRSELSGNAKDHSFEARIAYLDYSGSGGPSKFITALGNGISKKTSTSDANVNFIMGYSEQACSATTYVCSSESSFGNFCVKNDGTDVSYGLDSTATNCTTLETTYKALVPLVNTDLSHAYVETGAAAVGL